MRKPFIGALYRAEILIGISKRQKGLTERKHDLQETV